MKRTKTVYKDGSYIIWNHPLDAYYAQNDDDFSHQIELKEDDDE